MLLIFYLNLRPTNLKQMNAYRLPAEWEKQALVQLTWPHAATDWADSLEEAEECFLNLAREICRREPLLVITPEPDAVKTLFAHKGVTGHEVIFLQCPTNDTWARDHGFLTLVNEGGAPPMLTDFRFNGWGLKFAAHLDNRINRRLFESGLLRGTYRDRRDFVLEGGSVDCDGQGTLLTTTRCLMAPNRNDTRSRMDIELSLKEALGARRVLWIEHGTLVGDDTDGHVDTLARFAPENTIVYVQCRNKADAHFAELKAMEDELRAFHTMDGKPYRLLPLPLPDAIYDEEDNRLPATYANFLPVNGAVLYPTYRQPKNDQEAARRLAEAFPGREVIGVDCTTLIRQHGSLHCATMQFPEGVASSNTPKEKIADTISSPSTKLNEAKRTIRVGLVQQTCGPDLNFNIEKLCHNIRLAANEGAQLVVLQELHNSPYFCQTEDTATFDLAEPIPGPSTRLYARMAAEQKVVLVTSLFEKRAPGLYHNTAVVFDSDGRMAGMYRKMHIPDDPAYYEKFYFAPGDLGFQPISTSVGRLGVQVCWDQWYPEGARLMTLRGAELLIYPTAIGWESTDPTDEQTRQLDAWMTVQRGHAVANGLPVVAVNRVGHEPDPSGHTSGIRFWGNSFACGPQGELLARAGDAEETNLVVNLDLRRSEQVRRWWPFLRDRRIDTFDDLTRRYVD